MMLNGVVALAPQKSAKSPFWYCKWQRLDLHMSLMEIRKTKEKHIKQVGDYAGWTEFFRGRDFQSLTSMVILPL
jgi:hypothetical protein